MVNKERSHCNTLAEMQGTLRTERTANNRSTCTLALTNRVEGSRSSRTGCRLSQSEFWDYLQQRLLQQELDEQALLQSDPRPLTSGNCEHLWSPQQSPRAFRDRKRERSSSQCSGTTPANSQRTRPRSELGCLELHALDESASLTVTGSERFIWTAKHPRKVFKRSLQ